MTSLFNRFFLVGLFLALFLSLGLCPAAANPVLASTPAPANKSSALLPIADQLQNLIGVPALQSPAAGAQSKADDTEEPATEPQETFGVRALNLLLSDFEILWNQNKDIATNYTAGTDFSSWLTQQENDQRHLDRWHSIGRDIFIIIGLPFLAALLLDFALLPFRRLLYREPKDALHRLCVLVGLVIVKLIPVVLFIGASLTLLDHFETQRLQRFVILNIVYAMTLNRLAATVIRVSLVPKLEALRFIPISNAQAENAYRWLTAFSLVIIYGYFLTDVARAVYIPASVISLFNHLLGLILVTMAIVLILQKRDGVTGFLRGSLMPTQTDLSILQGLRLWLARRWHIFAIVYLIAGFSMTLADVQNGFNLILRGTILTLLILVSLRFFLLAMERWFTSDPAKKVAIHRLFLIFILRCVAWLVAVMALLSSWGFDLSAFFATALGQRLLGASFSIGITIGLTFILYEGLNAFFERQLNRKDPDGKPIPATARMRTLLPMLRNTFLIIFAAIIALVSLSEAGINIAPLLAGAGVVGVAIGFGSQTLVKDFLTGLFIIVENTIAIGDYVKIGDHAGSVEAMSLRTLRIRDNDGALHILPFSEVSQIINMTKDFAFAVIDVGVSYECDLEHAMTVMRSVGDALQQDPIFKRVILEPIEILGIEKLGDSAITLRARIRTRAGKQWDVKRIYLLKMKQRFDKEGIEIPYPIVAQVQRSSAS